MKYSIALLFLFLSIAAYCQKYSNEFLSIGVGAKAQALGNAQVASTNDVTAGFWNPAGLALVRDYTQISVMHAEWFASIGKYDYIGIAQPLKNSKRTIGFSFIRFGIDDIPNTLSLYEDDGTVNYDNIVPFSAADYAFLLSYAQPLGDNGLYIGGNAKIVHRLIGSFANSWGFGLDAGLQYRPNQKWSFGLLGKDITTTFNAWRFSFTDEEKETLAITGNDIPINSVEITRPRLVLGAAYLQQLGKVGLQVETNLNLTTDGQRNVLLSANPISVDPVLGIEANYNNSVFLRLGANNVQRETDLVGNEFWAFHPNAGVGVKLGKLYVDYAFTNVGESSNNTFSHIVSLKLDLNVDYIKRAMKNAERE